MGNVRWGLLSTAGINGRIIPAILDGAPNAVPLEASRGHIGTVLALYEAARIRPDQTITRPRYD